MPCKAAKTLKLIGIRNSLLMCDDAELATTFLALAAGDLTVEALAAWFRERGKAA